MLQFASSALHVLLVVAILQSLLLSLSSDLTAQFALALDSSSQCKPGIISPVVKASMVYDPTALRNERFKWLMANFTEALFVNATRTGPYKVDFTIDNGNAEIMCGGLAATSEQLLNHAHHHVWKRFVEDKSAGCLDSHLIFQHDAVLGREDAGDILLQHVSKGMPEDIMFFGFCFKSIGIPKFLKQRRYNKYHPRVTGLVPHCLHAYAVSMHGAQVLAKEIDPCGKSVDLQIAELTDVKKVLTFNYSNTTFDHFYMHRQFDVYGMHMKHDDDYGPNRDGIFPQVDPDLEPPKYMDGTASYLVGTRAGSMFILVDQVCL
jgi:hypothetical protein